MRPVGERPVPRDVRAAPVPGLPSRGWRVQLPGGATFVAGGRSDGDYAEVPAGAGYTWLRQVHGARVVVVDAAGQGQGEEADAAVTATSGAPLVVRTADCVPIGLASPQGVVAVAHAGWRGLLAGVVEACVGTMRRLGAQEVSAAVGPYVHPHAYEFSEADLGAVAARLGGGVRARTVDGSPALDLGAAVRAALGGCGAELVAVCPTCTHCSDEHWSWRARRDSGRQASVVWVGEQPARG